MSEKTRIEGIDPVSGAVNQLQVTGTGGLVLGSKGGVGLPDIPLGDAVEPMSLAGDPITPRELDAGYMYFLQPCLGGNPGVHLHLRADAAGDGAATVPTTNSQRFTTSGKVVIVDCSESGCYIYPALYEVDNETVVVGTSKDLLLISRVEV